MLVPLTVLVSVYMRFKTWNNIWMQSVAGQWHFISTMAPARWTHTHTHTPKTLVISNIISWACRAANSEWTATLAFFLLADCTPYVQEREHLPQNREDTYTRTTPCTGRTAAKTDELRKWAYCVTVSNHSTETPVQKQSSTQSAIDK